MQWNLGVRVLTTIVTFFSTAVCLLISAEVPAADSTAKSFSDDFTDYEDGSFGEPHWDARHIGFSMENGAMRADLTSQRGFTLRANAPAGRQVLLEADVTPQEPRGREWRTAGVGVYLDERNYWHLALAESPDGKRKFAELSEMYSGTWNAQHAPGSALKTVEDTGAFAWEYGKTYRLRISLEPDQEHGRIVGEISAGNARKYRCVQLLTDHAVDCGRPMLVVSSMAAMFDNVRGEVDDVVAVQPNQPRQDFPPFAIESAAPLTFGTPQPELATGFFHVTRDGDTWWLVDPNGQRMLSLGTDHVRYEGHWCEKLGYPPYGRQTQKKYGSAEKWAEEATRRLKAWNFNMLGAGNSPQARYQGVAHTDFIRFGTDFSSVAHIVEKTTWTGFPDVFDPRFERFCDIRARAKCVKGLNDPWLMGYFLDNELEWWGKTWRPGGMLEEAFTLPADSAAKQTLVRLLREQFGGDIAAFNTAFQSNVGSFNEVLVSTVKLQVTTPAAQAASDAFLDAVARRYFEVTTAAVRRYDPNHMVIGCRFAHNAPDAAWRAAGATCDLVTMNTYPRVDMQREHVFDMAEHLASRYELCGKPIIVTEWSFPALDAVDSFGRPLPSQHGAGMRVDTQAQKAACYTIMQRSLFELPFIVGSHYFMWSDEPSLGISSTFPEDSNYGLVSESDEPYELLTQTAKRVNAQMPTLHAGKIAAEDVEVRHPPQEDASAIASRSGGLTLTRDAESMVIDNGALRLSRDARAPFLHIEWRDDDGKWIELGRYEATLFVTANGRKEWPRATRITGVDVVEQTPDNLTLDITFAYDHTPRWEAAYRFHVERGQPWFTAKGLWIKNGSQQAIKFGGYYHYLPPRIGGEAANDVAAGARVPNYYLPVTTWFDPDLSLHFGALSMENDARLALRFWADGDGKHPDAWRKADVHLQPGDTWRADPDEPWTTVFGMKQTDKLPRPWLSILYNKENQQ
jgi:hypothetical protein